MVAGWLTVSWLGLEKPGEGELLLKLHNLSVQSLTPQGLGQNDKMLT